MESCESWIIRITSDCGNMASNGEDMLREQCEESGEGEWEGGKW